MENNELQHWGILGMRWGVRRYQNKDGSLTKAGQKRYSKEMNKLKEEERVLKNNERTRNKMAKLEAQRKKVEGMRNEYDNEKNRLKEEKKALKAEKRNLKEQRKKGILSDEELRYRVNRLQLEKQYRELMSQRLAKPEKKESRVKKVIGNILEKSGEDIGSQLVSFVAGKGVNKIFANIFDDPAIVDPKLMQKKKK